MTDDFTPIIKPSVKYYTSRIRLVKAEEDKLIEEKKKLTREITKKGTKEKRNHLERLAAVEAEAAALARQRKKLVAELEERIHSSRFEKGSEDDTLKPYNECVGYAFGKCIYVESNGEIRYRESEEHESDKIGDTVLEDVPLGLFSKLPQGEQKMILRYLDDHPDTPEWFKKRNE